MRNYEDGLSLKKLVSNLEVEAGSWTSFEDKPAIGGQASIPASIPALYHYRYGASIDNLKRVS